MAEPTVVQQLAALAARTRAEGLTDELRDDVARRVLDLLGNALAATEEPPARSVTAVVRAWGGAEQASAVGTGLRLPAPSAALVNGTLAHSLDFDDTHLPSVLHPSSSVIPAALAVAEQVGASGAALLDAAGVGVEVAVRLGMGGYDEAAGASVFFDRGQHATSICGAVGAAVAAATVAGLDEGRIADAAGIAASMGAGLLEANRTGGTVKRVHCGWAAHAGVVAAELAREGLTGPPTVVEGRFGFLRAHVGEQGDAEAVVRGLGEHWELPGIVFKPYPCNHFTHSAVDAALEVRSRGVRAADVVEVELGAPTAVLRTIAEPAEEKARPRSGYHAAFSGPYVVAAALTGGGGLGVFHEDFTDEAARDPERLRIAGLVRCVPDAECDALFPRQFPAVLRVRTASGDQHEVRVPASRGGPDNPLTAEELVTKFRLNAARALVDDTVEQVARAAAELPRADGLGDLLAGVRG